MRRSRRPFRTLTVLLLTLLGGGVWACTGVDWSPDPAIYVADLSSPASVGVGFTVSIDTILMDYDTYSSGGSSDLDVDMVLTTLWEASAGTFLYGNTNPSAVWQAPDTPGTVNFTLTVDDVPEEVVPPDTGSRDDTPLVWPFTVEVAPRVWEGSCGLYGTADGPDCVQVNHEITLTASGSDTDTWLSGTGWTQTGGSEADPVTYTWSAPSGTFPYGNTGESVVWRAGETAGDVEITCNIDDVAELPEGDQGSRDDDPYPAMHTVTVWKISSLRVRRTGSGNDFAGVCVLAAGGKGTDEHKADVEVGVTPAVYDVEVPAPSVVEPTGTGAVINASVGGGGTTGWDGKAVFQAAFASSDVLRDVTIEVGEGVEHHTAQITQVWNGNGTPWDYSPYFYYDEPSPVTFRPKLADGEALVPIQTHTMNFLVTSAAVWHWNQDILDGEGDYELLTYTNDPADPNSGLLAELTEFTPLSAGDSGGGTYSSDITVFWDIDEVVDTVWFYAQDDGVYAEE